MDLRSEGSAVWYSMGENLEEPDFRISFVGCDLGVEIDEDDVEGVVDGVGRGCFW